MRKKRSIMGIPNNEYCGNDRIREYYETAKRMDSLWVSSGIALTFCVLFVTGARVSEALALKVEHVRVGEKYVTVDKLVVLKQKRGKSRTRTFIIPRDDLLCEEFITYYEEAKAEGRTYMLYGHVGAGSNERDLSKPTTRSLVYKRMTMLSKDLWPQRIRDLRALYFIIKRESGGFEFDVYALQSWFGWKSAEMPLYYTKGNDVDTQRRAFEGRN